MCSCAMAPRFIRLAFPVACLVYSIKVSTRTCAPVSPVTANGFTSHPLARVSFKFGKFRQKEDHQCRLLTTGGMRPWLRRTENSSTTRKRSTQILRYGRSLLTGVRKNYCRLRFTQLPGRVGQWLIAVLCLREVRGEANPWCLYMTRARTG